MLNYKELGTKIGLEIHQELLGFKLFCSCSADLKEKIPEIEIIRKLRASMGESGNIDIAAEFEQAKDRIFIYRGYKDEYCLVDIDESPPMPVNEEALLTALTVAKLFKLYIPNCIQVMRKVIVDGSSCSSFQKSINLGLESKDSYLNTSFGKVKISSLCLEEDACKIEIVEGKKVFYSLSRQGIPLLEIRTEPDIKTPEQAKEVAELIGTILRSFPITKRGIGSIRQDINISIKNGARVELKGVQDLRNIPKIIDIEIKRQLSIIKEGKKVEPGVRKINPDLTSTYLRPLPGSSRMYPESDLPLIYIDESLLNKIEIPELLTDKIGRLRKEYGLSRELANEIVKENKIELFENFTNKYKNLNPGLIAHTLIETPKEIESKFNVKTEKLTDEIFSSILENLNSGKISKNSVIDILLDYIKTGKLEITKYKTVDKEELEKEIKTIIEKNKDLSFGALMGIIMEKFKGKVEGRLASELIKKYKK